MARLQDEFTGSQLLGINAALGFLFPKELEKVGVELAWDVVVNQNSITPIIKMINEMGRKINQEFYEENPEDKTKMRIIKGKEDACIEAEKALEEKKFKVQLKPFKLDEIKAIEGITVKELFQLHPILTK